MSGQLQSEIERMSVEHAKDMGREQTAKESMRARLTDEAARARAERERRWEEQGVMARALVAELESARVEVGPVDPSFRALSGCPKFLVRRHKFNKDSLSGGASVRGSGDGAREGAERR